MAVMATATIGAFLPLLLLLLLLLHQNRGPHGGYFLADLCSLGGPVVITTTTSKTGTATTTEAGAHAPLFFSFSFSGVVYVLPRKNRHRCGGFPVQFGLHVTRGSIHQHGNHVAR